MKAKRIISLLASLAMMVTAVTGAMTVSAETDSGDCGEVKWSFDSSTGKLTISGEGAMASPQSVNTSGAEVEPEKSDFSNTYTYKKYKDSIIEVEIETGVTSIGFCAFYKMPNLETVSLPSTIKEFVSFGDAYYAYYNFSFAECTSLKNLTLADGMTALGGGAFRGCTALESVRIPSTLTASTNDNGSEDVTGKNGWGVQTFEGCTSLKDVTLPEGLTVIGAYAFHETAIESIVIPSTIKKWSLHTAGSNSPTINDAFLDCRNLSSVTFKNGITCINGSPFRNCSSLKKVIIPASVTDLTRAFAGAGADSEDDHRQAIYLEEVAFEDGSQLTELGVEAFRLCYKLKTLELPESLTGIDRSFQKVRSLENLYVYSQNVSIGGYIDDIAITRNVRVYSYLGSKASKEVTFHDIEEEMSKTYDELSTAVEEANKYSEEKYTEESYGVLKELLEQASTKSEESHILGMKYLTEDIYSAIEGLEEKKDEPSSSDPEDSSNPTDNSSDPSNSSGNNNQSQSPNTPATPSTSAPTTATPKPVTPPTVTTTVAKPAKVKSVKLKAKKKKLNVSWKKVSGATGYEVLSSTNNKFTKNKKSVTVKKNKVTLKKLKPKKKYFVKVRAYKLANGRKYFGKWSKVVKKKVK